MFPRIFGDKGAILSKCMEDFHQGVFSQYTMNVRYKATLGAYLTVEIYESIEKNVVGCINWRQTAQLSKKYQFSVIDLELYILEILSDNDRSVFVRLGSNCIYFTQKRCASSNICRCLGNKLFQSSQPYKAFGRTIVL